MAAIWSTVAGSLKLLLGRIPPRDLEDDIKRKYSEPVELRTALRETLAGLTSGEQELFRAHLAGRERILDIGCASGRVTLTLTRQGYEAVGVDVSEAMIGQASRLARETRSRSSFAVMDARHLGFPDTSFDAVLMVGSVIGYIKGRQARIQALREAHRVLRPGGYFAVVTPSRDYSLRFRAWFLMMRAGHAAVRLLGRASDWEPGDRFGPAWSGERSRLLYWHMYSPAELQADLASAGLAVVHAAPDAYMMCYVARRQPPDLTSAEGVSRADGGTARAR